MNGNGHNGNRANGNGHNGNGHSSPVALSAAPGVAPVEDAVPKTPAPPNRMVQAEAFDQPVILQQTNLWSRAIVWGIVGVSSIVVLWASFARIEEAVPATGKLEPQAQVQEIQAPVGGVVKEILVQNDQEVKQGDLLIRFDPTTAEAQRRSLEQVRSSLQQQNAFYRSQLSGATSPSLLEAQQLKLPPEVLSLTANRAALLAENQLYQAQLTGSINSAALSPDQQARLRAGLQESQSREAAAQLEISQLQQQLSQAQTQLSQTQAQLASARQNLTIDEKIYSDLVPLLENGGISRLQVVRQEQQVIQSRAEVDRLSQEQQRLQFAETQARYAIDQAQEKYQNTQATSSTDLQGRIAENNKQIATIDSQLNKAIVDNENQIAQIESQLSEANQTLKYQELRSPIDGVVFDLQAKGPGFVANNSEPIVKIVPSDGLTAEVFITNQDIGFVREGMHVDVRVDSFPFSEFGDIKGTLVQIGQDALPPDQVNPFYRFPAKVQLETQFIDVNGTQIPLQSGMSVTGNIITRDRTVMSIFTDLFSRRIESLKTVR